MHIRQRLWVVIILVICCLSGRISTSQESDTPLINREYPLKAIFLYNFAGYVEWPTETFANEQSPFVIGVYGSSQIDETLRTIANSKKVGTRNLEFRRYLTVKEIKQCHILFITREVPVKQLNEILAVLKSEPVLVVGESPGFANAGTAMNFFIEANKIRFEVNTDATKQLGLKVSSKLLSMAKVVSDDSAKR
jgi:hypothetical protein